MGTRQIHPIAGKTNGRTSEAVVVGVNNSPAGTAALRWAQAEASRRQATLRVIHVHDVSERADLALERDPSGELGEVRRRLFAQVASRLDSWARCPNVVVTAARGPLLRTLARDARGAAMLVIGEPVHLEQLNLPDELSSRCACPVVVVDEQGGHRFVSGARRLIRRRNGSSIEGSSGPALAT
jgi:nucleotide-binding universal stress UspA family protein